MVATVESIHDGAPAGGINSASVTLPAGSLQPGDVIVLIEGNDAGLGLHTGVSGLGATWTLLPDSQTAATTRCTRMWLGIGATADSGTIQGSGSGNKSLQAVAFTALVVRGASSTGITAAADGSLTTATASLDVAVGGLAIGAGLSASDALNAAGPGIDSLTPAGWVKQTPRYLSARGSYATAYHESSTAEAHTVTAVATTTAYATASIVALIGAATTPSVSATLTMTAGGSLSATAERPVTADLTVTAGGTLAGTQRQVLAATLTVTATGSLDAVDVPPGAQAITATLTSTPTGTLAGTVEQALSATLTVTATGSLSALSDGDLTATLTVTPSGSLAGVKGAAWYVGAALTVTPTAGSLTGDASATATAALTFTATGSLWGARQWAHDPATGKGTFRLIAAHRDGTPRAELHHASLTGPITDALNDVDGSGSGLSFALPRTDPAIAHCPQFGEVQVYRGGHHLGTRILIRPNDNGTNAAIPYQGVGLGWYLTKRRIGPARRPGLLTKNWRAGFREGSIPAAPPRWERINEPAQVGPSLRVKGSTEVQVTTTRLGSDTTFARGSWILTSEGKTALREFARTVEVDRDPTDLEDIAPPVITVEGHTDSEPYTSHPGGNQWLSEQRAKAVYDFLAPLLPDEATLTWVGYGQTRPIASNATAGGRAQNRRVDIKYPKMVSARGHRQYLEDRIVYTNPSAHLKRNLTLVSWWQLESYKEPNADGSIAWVGRRPVGGTDADWVETDHAAIDDETPLNTWTRSEVTITVPADGQAWEIVARLTPPAGDVIYDEGATQLYADDALEFHGVDQALIVKALIEHAQDPAFDKSDLHLTTDTPLTGIKRDRVYYHHDRWAISAALAELCALSDGPEITIDTTPTTRTVRTHHPKAGQESTVTLSTMGNADDYALALDGESSATTVIMQADGSGADREEGVAMGADLLGGLVLEDVYTAEPGTHIGELTEQARTAHARYAGHVPIVAVTIDRDDTDTLLDQLSLGDRVDVEVRSPLHPIRQRGRVTSWSLHPDSDRLTYVPTLEATNAG